MRESSRLRYILDLIATIGTIASSLAIVLLAIAVIRTLASNRVRVPTALAGQVVTPVEGLETTADTTTKRERGAKLVLVEFSDFECPFCGRHARDTHAKIQRDLVDPGIVNYVFRHFPLSNHPLAFDAAEAAECAGEQNRYWDMHARLFADQQRLAPLDLRDHARALGLDNVTFEACLDGRMAAKIKQDQAEGSRLGVTATPTFLIGIAQPNGRIKVVRKFTGAQPFDTFKVAIESVAAELDRSS